MTGAAAHVDAHRNHARSKLLMTAVSEKPSSETISQTPTRKKGWKAFITMLLGLLLGVGFALAHHFMNTALNNKPVDSVTQLPQAWVSRFATAFTFLVKSMLVLVVGTAFIQRQWLDFHHQAVRVKDIDTIVGVRGSVISLLNLVWLKYPLLCMIALISWTIPIAAIIAPGSLSIQNIETATTSQLQVPELSFNNSLYSDTQTVQGDLSLMENNAVTSVVMATASNGRVLSIPGTFAPNQTYDLTFFGPALRCNNASTAYAKNVSSFLKNMQSTSDPENTVTFAAWTPLGLNNTFTGITPPWTLDTTQNSSLEAGLYIMSDPISAINQGGPQIFTECRLHNASYSVHFDFHYPEQTLTITNLEYLASISWPTTSGNDFPDLKGLFFSYLAIMSAVGRLIVGYEKYGVFGETTRVYTNYNVFNINWTNADAISSGMEQVFQNITLGLFSNPSFYEPLARTDAVPVTITTSPSTYIYDSRDLLLAYGLAIGATLLCCLFGFHAVLINKGSFQNIFSTFIRATNHLDQTRIEEGDNGADPLPDNLARQAINMNGNRSNARF